MTQNTNGHRETQSGPEQSMAEANGHTNHNISDLEATNDHTIDVKSPSETPVSLNGSLSHKEEQKMAKKPLRGGATVDEVEGNGRKRSRRRCCCLSCAAVALVIVVTIVVLALTVFKPRDPKITVTSMSVEGLESSFDAGALRAHLNLTVLVGMAIDNPNKIASFKHGNSTTLMIYRGGTVGEAVIPAGKIKADKTVYKNVTVTIYIDQFMESGSGLVRDGISGSLNLTTRTEIGGRVKIIGLIKKHISVRMECSITVDVSTKTAEMQRCSKNIKL